VYCDLPPADGLEGIAADETGGFVAEHPARDRGGVGSSERPSTSRGPTSSVALEAVAQGEAGPAIFSDWGRYGRGVALPSGLSYCCRIGVNIVFMAAFGIPITAFTVFLIASSHMLLGAVRDHTRRRRQTQALDIATLRSDCASSDIAPSRSPRTRSTRFREAVYHARREL
jgi:hypothetical protein